MRLLEESPRDNLFPTEAPCGLATPKYATSALATAFDVYILRARAAAAAAATATQLLYNVTSANKHVINTPPTANTTVYFPRLVFIGTRYDQSQ